MSMNNISVMMDGIKDYVVSIFAHKNQLLKKNMLLPFSIFVFIYMIFVRKSGFIKASEFKKQQPVKPDEEYKGEEIPVVHANYPIVSGWLINKIARHVGKTLFGRLFLESRKRSVDSLRTSILPESPTFYPLVKGDNELYEQHDVTNEELWGIVRGSMTDVDFHFITMSDLLQLYRSNKITPSNVVDQIIKALNEFKQQEFPVNAMIEYYEDLLIKQASASTKRWKEGKPLSIFDGIPVAVKDEYIVGNHHSRNGTQLPSKKYAIEDELGLVRKLREGGAIMLGITNMHQIGIGVFGINQSKYHGTNRNPYNTNYSAGGSSGGSASAIASGLCPVALGTDGGGSIRLPAAVCGVVGLKATYSRYTMAGMLSNCYTMGHTGPLCATVRDTALSYGFLAGKDEDYQMGLSQPAVTIGNFENSDLSGLKVGVDWRFIDAADPEIKDGCLNALQLLERDFNVEVVDIRIPEKQEAEKALAALISSEMENSNKVLRNVYYEEMNTDVLTTLAAGEVIDAHGYLQAAKQRTRSINGLKYIFSKVDVVLLPAFLSFQPYVTRSMEKYGYMNLNLTLKIASTFSLCNLTGNPAITLPVCYSEANLPIGVQLIASWWREDLLLKVAFALERNLKLRKPDLYVDLTKCQL